jgi:MarR family transcriptional regulator, organic hydroperoxide resistance regulator
MSIESEFQAVMGEWVRETTHRSMGGLFRYVKENGLSMPQVGALFNIRRNSEKGVADLGEELGVSSAAASQMLDKLVQQGLVTRNENPDDRRSKLLSLTERGQGILRRSIEARQFWIEELANSLSADEILAASSAISMLVHKTRTMVPESNNPECHGKGIERL